MTPPSRTWLVLHSPFVGPSTVRPLAGLLAAGGDVVVVPDLRSAVEGPPPYWRRIVDAAVGSVHTTLPGTVLVVAHSRAGAYVPAVVERLGGAAGVVLIDAVLPPRSGSVATPVGLRRFLAGLVGTDGRLPPWHRWWGEEALDALVPDPGQRRVIEDEIPSVPLGLSDEIVPVPAGWTAGGVAYLRTSDAYDEEAAAATAAGWPVARVEGQHLHLASAPGEVVARVTGLARLCRRTGRTDTAVPGTGERFRTLAQMGNTVVEEIVSSATPEPVDYRQDHDEWVMVVEGAAVLDVDGSELHLSAGGWVLLERGTPHRVVATEAGTRWLAVHVHGEC